MNVEWDRRPEEPLEWFNRFDKYGRTLGAEFSTKHAFLLWRLDQHKKGVVVAGGDLIIWAETAAKWGWDLRAKAWAEYDRTLRTVTWHQRRQQLMEDDWSDGNSLRAVGKEFLKALQVYTEMGEDEEGNRIVKININPAQLPQLFRAATELQRLGLGEPTEIVQHQSPQIYLPEIGG